MLCKKFALLSLIKVVLYIVLKYFSLDDIMKNLEEAIKEINEGQVRFKRLVTICESYFGKSRIAGSHHIFKTPWPGDPRLNLQEEQGGKAKPYQVRQVIQALQKLQEQKNET